MSATDVMFQQLVNQKRRQMARNRTGDKSANFKEAKKYHTRREQKIQRECQNQLGQIIAEEKQYQRAIWAPVDKVDLKFRVKQQELAQKDNEPSKKALLQQMLEEENRAMDSQKIKTKKNGWGKAI